MKCHKSDKRKRAAPAVLSLILLLWPNTTEGGAWVYGSRGWTFLLISHNLAFPCDR